MKNVQRINESQLRAIVAESVKKVLNEMALHNKATGEWHRWDMGDEGSAPYSSGKEEEYKWKYDGDECDKLMWYLKKDAQKCGKIRNDGWPTLEYIKGYVRSLEHYCDRDIDCELSSDYTPEDLYRACDNFCYAKGLAYYNKHYAHGIYHN